MRQGPSRAVLQQAPMGSHANLLALPANFIQELLKLYEVAETTGEWPLPMVVGLIALLEKVALASFVHRFRPNSLA